MLRPHHGSTQHKQQTCPCLPGTAAVTHSSLPPCLRLSSSLLRLRLRRPHAIVVRPAAARAPPCANLSACCHTHSHIHPRGFFSLLSRATGRSFGLLLLGGLLLLLSHDVCVSVLALGILNAFLVCSFRHPLHLCLSLGTILLSLIAASHFQLDIAK